MADSSSRMRLRRGKTLNDWRSKAGVGNGFDRDVDQCAEPASDQDDPQPEGVGAAPDEVNNGERLQQNAPPRKREKE